MNYQLKTINLDEGIKQTELEIPNLQKAKNVSCNFRTSVDNMRDTNNLTFKHNNHGKSNFKHND